MGQGTKRRLWATLAAGAILWSPVGAAASAADPLADQQWALAAANAAPAPGDGSGVTVAVIGGGLAAHPDLPSIEHHACIGTGGQPDRCGSDAAGVESASATHAAGIIAARQGNGIGIAGIAPAARLLDLRVVERGVANGQDIDAAILLAAHLGARVALVVLPDVGLGPMPSSGDAVRRALDAGTLVVGGAGTAANVLDGTAAVGVRSLDRSGRPVDAVPTRARWELAAPGGVGAGDAERAVVSTAGDGSYAAMSGTWVAAAHVAAAAGVLQADGIGAAAAAQRLVDTASPATTRDAPGRLDVTAARTAQREPAAEPATTPTSVASSATDPATTLAPARTAVSLRPAEPDAPPGVLRYPSRGAVPPTTVAAIEHAAASGRPPLRPHAVQILIALALVATAGILVALVRASRAVDPVAT
jgi:serine protease